MGHFVNEEALQARPFAGEIVAPKRGARMKPEVAVGGHCRASGLERPPAAAVDRHPLIIDRVPEHRFGETRSEEHTSELQSLMRISYAVFCLKKKKKKKTKTILHR